MPTKPIASEEIYDALVDDECFAELPSRLARVFGGRSALIYWTYPDGGGEILQSSNISQDLLDRYAREFSSHDPWLRATDSGDFNNQALSLEELVPAREYARTFFYNEFIRPMGADMFRCLGIRVDNPWGSGIVAIHRERGQRSFDPDAIASLDLYAPALRRMLAVRGRLAAMERRLDAVEGMLDHVGQAIILVAVGGAVAHANAAGEALMRRGDALVRTRGSLSARSSVSALKLRRAIAQACAPYGMEANLLLVERPSGRPMAVSVVPFRATTGLRQALLIIEDDSRTTAGIAPRLRTLYGLTPAEAEIGSRIADGVSPGEIAAERGVSVETVRSQIKSLSAKLGCTRQSEIVALVRTLPAPNPASDRPHAAPGGLPAKSS